MLQYCVLESLCFHKDYTSNLMFKYYNLKKFLNFESLGHC